MIVVLIHFDMVPGSRTKERYATSVNRWQARTNATSVVLSQTMVIGDDTGPPHNVVIPPFDEHRRVLEQGKRRTDDRSSLSGV
jgi:hypothetical protein